MNKLSTVAVAALLCACGQPESADVADETAANDSEITFANDEERILYTLGVVLGDNISDFRLTDDEFELVTAGMRDSIAGVPPRVEVDLYGPQLQVLANERMSVERAAAAGPEKQAAAEFADEIAAEAGAMRTDSGVVIVPITEGDGANPAASDTVTVHYHGTLRDGSVFDSSVERDMPATFSLSAVIPCWTEGVQRMRVGGKARLTCPPAIAYGARGAPPRIPPNATLVFEVELLEIAR